MKKGEKKTVVKEQPENSVPLRIVVFLMSLLCISGSCYFAKLDLPIFIMYIVATVVGSFLSYHHRQNEVRWLRYTAFAGIILVGYIAGKKFISPLTTEYDFVAPFVVFLAGIFASLCFEMRSRSDLNLSSGLGLMLLCITAPVAKGLTYGGLVAAYILLGTAMLYYDCISRTMNAWLEKEIEEAPRLEFASGKTASRRNKFGSTIGLMALLPLIAACMFLFMPRVDSFLDELMAYTKALNPDYVLDAVMPSKLPAQRAKGGRGQSAREWFEKNSDVLSNLKKNEKQNKEMQDKIADAAGRKKVPPKKADENKKDKDRKDKVENSPESKPKSQDKDQDSKDSKEDANKNPKKDPKDNASKKSGKKPHQKSKKNEKAKDKGTGKSRTATQAGSKPGGSKESRAATAGTDASNSANGAGANDGKGGKGGEGGEGGKGGKGGEGGKGGSGGGGASDEISISDENEVDLRQGFAPSSAKVLKIKSRRLTYLRRQCYDRFNGNVWSNSKAKDKVKSVKVVDGTIKRDSIKEAFARAARQKVAQPAAQPQALAPSSILMKGGALKRNDGVVLSQGGEQAVQSSPTPTPTPTAVADKGPDQDIVAKLSKGRQFEFLSRERPLFMVGLADALTVPDKYPSINITQEVTVEAKSLGKVLPGAWIPQEIILDQKELSVDRLGVIRTDDELVRGTKFKVKTELPIFNIAYMRQRPPLGADEEELVRDNFSQYLQLPSSVTDSLFEMAESNTSPEFNWFVQSEQLAEFLRKNYKFNPEAVYNNETNGNIVNSFLVGSQGGQSNHFASAFVILNRCIGIPSRLVTGFGPGELNRVTGRRDVSGLDIHTWAESYIPEFGWVPFDATPEGFLPAQQRETEYSAEDIKEELGLNKEEKKKEVEKIVDIALWVIGGLVSLTLLALLLRKLIPMLLAWYRKRTLRGPEWNQYKKVTKAVKESTNVNRNPSDTPKEYVFRVNQAVDRLSREGAPTPSGLPESLEQFMHLYSSVYFGKRKELMEDLKYYADLVSTHAKNRK